MVAPVFHKIVQGETLEFEILLVDENLADASVSITTSAGMPTVEFALTVVLPNIIQVRADSTQNFSPGDHQYRVWLNWPGGTDEVVNDGLVNVSAALDFWVNGTGVIDGGAPGTIHEDIVDGGSP